VPFVEMLDRRTGRVRVRYVDISSESYRTHLAYMIRLKAEDLAPDRLPPLSKSGNLSDEEFKNRFGPLLERRTKPR
jgi:6-phosphofructokinase 1